MGSSFTPSLLPFVALSNLSPSPCGLRSACAVSVSRVPMSYSSVEELLCREMRYHHVGNRLADRLALLWVEQNGAVSIVGDKSKFK